MTENSKLNHMAMTIGAISKRDDRIALKVAKARVTAKRKLAAINQHVKVLKRQLLKNTEGLPVAGNVSF